MTKEDQKHIDAMCAARQALIGSGWREPNQYKDAGRTLDMIEAGSTGQHRGHCDIDGEYWILDEVMWPSNPLLVKDVEGGAG